MVSEDSDQLVSGLASIHRLRDLRDLRQTLTGQMRSRLDHRHAASELLKVRLLRRVQPISPEERNDRLKEILPTPNHVSIQVLAMVVVPPVRQHLSHPEKRLELAKTLGALRALRHSKLVRHLITGPVAAPTRPVILPDKADREASFSVYKTQDPTELNQPFLLVSCTRHIVTLPPSMDGTVARDAQAFQHMAGCAPHGYPCGGQRYLRTVPTVTTWTIAQAVGTFLADSHGRP
jgi:hypothetical protein